jgi:hypothetical protein
VNAETRQKYIRKAYDRLVDLPLLCAGEDIQIDDDAQVSDALPEGVWVQAWVWVPEDETS